MDTSKKKRQPPAKTVAARENQLIALAMDLAEEQMLKKTASSQVMTHFLKLASTREELEKEKLRRENLVLAAKVDAISSAGSREKLYAEALEAMRRYTGQEPKRTDDE